MSCHVLQRYTLRANKELKIINKGRIIDGKLHNKRTQAALHNNTNVPRSTTVLERKGMGLVSGESMASISPQLPEGC